MAPATLFAAQYVYSTIMDILTTYIIPYLTRNPNHKFLMSSYEKTNNIEAILMKDIEEFVAESPYSFLGSKSENSKHKVQQSTEPW